MASFTYAKVAANERDRAAWLRIAEGFMALFRQNQAAEEGALFGACVIADAKPNEAVSLN
ncbi:MAG: hypothetical protein ACREEK_06215 [Bradyrhizobium sp.]